MAKIYSKAPGATRGFTLMEMLIVLVIIGMLASLVGPRMFGHIDESKMKTAKVQVKMLKGALETLHMDTGIIPSKEQGLDLLYTPPQDPRLKSLWKGPYLDDDLPLDPWGSPYQYDVPGSDGRRFALFSFGADGKAGGEDVNADIGYLPPR